MFSAIVHQGSTHPSPSFPDLGRRSLCSFNSLYIPLSEDTHDFVFTIDQGELLRDLLGAVRRGIIYDDNFPT